VRAAAPAPGLRLNLIETLRAAAPWQRLRATGSRPGGPKIRLEKSDFRVTRTEQRARTVTIFLVDASGSSALNRLAEAKGAVELLLADCYKRRDEVAVLAFRGKTAELLLPPTRSLVRAKRSLSGLPGGGGTPLAAGIDAGFLLAESVRRAGDTPTLVLLTDGRANVTLAGTGGRAQAEQEAVQAARRVRSAGHSALFLDISPRPGEQGRRLAREMAALYLPLPYADAASVSRAVRDAAQTK
jgi:magnesium chelatase subunit D